jgi:PhnB protein
MGATRAGTGGVVVKKLGGETFNFQKRPQLSPRSNLLVFLARTQREEAAMAVNPVPKGYNSVTPYLIVNGAARAIEFYKLAFGATEIMRMPGPNGRVMHAELRIGDSVIMLADEPENGTYKSAQALGGTPVSLMIYIADVDKVFERALSAGAKQTRAVQDQFYGDRSGNLTDPFGHSWTVSTHVEDVSPEEMQRRMAELPKTA